MKFIRSLSVLTATCGVALTLGGTALASDVSVDTTGPGSSQSVTIDNSTDVTTTNTNIVEVSTKNVQEATTGDVGVTKNTSVSGGLSSGDSSNNNVATTTVSIGNDASGFGQGGNVDGGTGGNGGQGGSTNGGGSTATGGNAPTGGFGGSVLGASTGGFGGAAMLPVTGPTDPMDVSALRNAWQPKSDAPTTNFVKNSRAVSTIMLIVAAVLSLIGAVGSAIYAQYQARRA